MTKQPTFTRRPRNEVWEKSAEIPYWWRVTTQIWVVTFHQYGISGLVSQTSFRGRRVKCRLFSQAKKKRGPNLFHLRPGLHAAATKSDFFVCVVKNRVWRFFAVLCHVDNHWSPERVADLTKFSRNCEKSPVWFLQFFPNFATACKLGHTNLHKKDIP